MQLLNVNKWIKRIYVNIANQMSVILFKQDSTEAYKTDEVIDIYLSDIKQQ